MMQLPLPNHASAEKATKKSKHNENKTTEVIAKV
jgi:hypothetical protein